MSRTIFFTARAVRQRRVVMIVSLSFALVSAGGCATARSATTSLWNQVPPVRWSNKGHDSNGPAERIEPTAEPAMAANVALKPDPPAETDLKESDAPGKTRSKSLTMRQGTRFNRVESRSRDGAAGSDLNDLDEANPELLVETERPDSSMERLTAALSDDAIQAQALPQQSLTALDTRFRVESLLSRARQLLDLGQFDQARQSAQLAQELGESTHLDYSPDEDRPIDLVRRIEEQMEATRMTDGPRSDNDTVESPAVPLEPAAPNSESKSGNANNVTGKDASGLARLRRDWSTLFRREKKPAAPEINSASLEAKSSAKPVAVTDLRNRDRQANHMSEPGLREPIVMANRSVSLETPEAQASPSVSFAPDVADQPATDADSIRSSAPSTADEDLLDARDLRAGPTVLTAQPSRPMAETDDGMSTQPEFDVGEAIIPVHEVESSVDEQPRPDDLDSNETRQSDWTYFYAGFGVCSLLALGCYRRGAT